MGHRLRSGPVRIILVPEHNAAMMCRLVEDLIVPEAHRTADQLRRRHREAGMPEDVMQTRQNTPRTESVEEDLVRIRGLVRVELIEQAIAWMAWINEVEHFAAEHFDLFIIQ